MKKIILFFTIACSVIFLLACTIHKKFVVKNESDRKITLEYRVKEGNFFPPEIDTSDKSKWFTPKDWTRMSADKFQFDEKEGKCTVTLNPKEEIAVESEDVRDIDKEGAESFDLISLRIIDNGKEIYFDNSERLFNEFKDNDFEIKYK